MRGGKKEKEGCCTVLVKYNKAVSLNQTISTRLLLLALLCNFSIHLNCGRSVAF